MLLVSAVGRIWVSVRTYIMVDDHPDLAEALEKWCESVSGSDPDRHALVSQGFGISSVSS